MSFKPNIDTTGRMLRAVCGLALAGAAWWSWDRCLLCTVALCAISALCFFQAARGWCFARACGLKTRW